MNQIIHEGLDVPLGYITLIFPVFKWKSISKWKILFYMFEVMLLIYFKRCRQNTFLHTTLFWYFQHKVLHKSLVLETFSLIFMLCSFFIVSF